MSEKYHLSLSTAILVNINIMMGAGVFINTVELSKRAGALGGFAYLLIGVLVLPLVLSLAALVNRHPSGGFYTFGAQEIHPFVGFVSAWSYFTGKLASAGLMIHASVRLLQQLTPVLASINPFFLDICLLSLFTLLNTLNVRTGGRIQALFMSLKIIPVAFVLLAAAFLARASNLSAAHLIWSGLPSTVPLALYAASGFEAACSLSSRIKDAHRNAPRAIIFSYLFVISLIALYQFAFYASLGTRLIQAASYLHVFPALAHAFAPNLPAVATILGALFNSAIALSALGGSYGILYSNNWNLYILAQHKHIAWFSVFTRLNAHHIPVLCVIAEACICALYLLITGGIAVSLQQISALAGIIAYTCSICAFLKIRAEESGSSTRWCLPLLALGSCFLLTFFCIKNMMIGNYTGLIFFSMLILLGIGMFWGTYAKESPLILDKKK